MMPFNFVFFLFISQRTIHHIIHLLVQEHTFVQQNVKINFNLKVNLHFYHKL